MLMKEEKQYINRSRTMHQTSYVTAEKSAERSRTLIYDWLLQRQHYLTCPGHCSVRINWMGHTTKDVHTSRREGVRQNARIKADKEGRFQHTGTSATWYCQHSADFKKTGSWHPWVVTFQSDKDWTQAQSVDGVVGCPIPWTIHSAAHH